MRSKLVAVLTVLASVLVASLNGIGYTLANEVESDTCYDQMSTFAQDKVLGISNLLSGCDFIRKVERPSGN